MSSTWTAGATQWAQVFGAAILVAALYESDPKLGAAFLALVVLVMLEQAHKKGYF